MSMNNYRWATEILAQRYPDWSGIDAILAGAIRAHFPADGFVLDVGCGKSSPVAEYRQQARFIAGTDIDLDELRSNHDFHALVASDGARLPCRGAVRPAAVQNRHRAHAGARGVLRGSASRAEA